MQLNSIRFGAVRFPAEGSGLSVEDVAKKIERKGFRVAVSGDYTYSGKDLDRLQEINFVREQVGSELDRIASLNQSIHQIGNANVTNDLTGVYHTQATALQAKLFQLARQEAELTADAIPYPKPKKEKAEQPQLLLFA